MTVAQSCRQCSAPCMMASADEAAAQRGFTAMMKLVKLDISALARAIGTR